MTFLFESLEEEDDDDDGEGGGDDEMEDKTDDKGEADKVCFSAWTAKNRAVSESANKMGACISGQRR